MLWITPMRALAADTARSLAAPLAELGLDWRVGVRSGDTDAGGPARQSVRLPEALVTTPESVSLPLTRPECQALFADLELTPARRATGAVPLSGELADAMLAERAAPAATLLAMGEIAAKLARSQAQAREEFAARFTRFAGPEGRERVRVLLEGRP